MQVMLFVCRPLSPSLPVFIITVCNMCPRWWGGGGGGGVDCGFEYCRSLRFTTDFLCDEPPGVLLHRIASSVSFAPLQHHRPLCIICYVPPGVHNCPVLFAFSLRSLPIRRTPGGSSLSYCLVWFPSLRSVTYTTPLTICIYPRGYMSTTFISYPSRYICDESGRSP